MSNKNIFTIERGELQTYAANMRALLTDLASSACDHCGERDCADCWAMDYPGDGAGSDA